MLPIPSETSISCQQLVLGNDNMNTKYNILYMRITNTDSYIEDKENMFYVSTRDSFYVYSSIYN